MACREVFGPSVARAGGTVYDAVSSWPVYHSTSKDAKWPGDPAIGSDDDEYSCSEARE